MKSLIKWRDKVWNHGTKETLLDHKVGFLLVKTNGILWLEVKFNENLLMMLINVQIELVLLFLHN